VYERRVNGTWQLTAELASDTNGRYLGKESVAVSGDGRVVAMGHGNTNEGSYTLRGVYSSSTGLPLGQ
jgi:hypothetical protein